MSPRFYVAGHGMPYAAATNRKTVVAVIVMRPGVSSNPPPHGTIDNLWVSAGRIEATSKVSRSIRFDGAETPVCVVSAETAIKPAKAESRG